ncbi:hypothetical protein B2J93_7297 [Marssonina coronariae]|uniref:CFEM domain-containing protein n=1 Tax=Diplocarpon coronariae TaxID=2795749 RepID=A0A218Z190_9HELO|nr:hypothetical protein B2J93_7297 [Marssonina coronariae]
MRPGGVRSPDLALPCRTVPHRRMYTADRTSALLPEAEVEKPWGRGVTGWPVRGRQTRPDDDNSILNDDSTNNAFSDSSKNKMHLSLAFVLAIAATQVSGQRISSLVAQLPSCAISCLATASANVGCGISDYACQCGAKKSTLTSSATPCVLSACSNADALTTNSLTGDICREAGIVQTSITAQGSMASVYPHATSTATTAASVTTIPVTTVTTIPGTILVTTSRTSSAPAATSSASAATTGAASRARGGVVAAGAAVLAALVL